MAETFLWALFGGGVVSAIWFIHSHGTWDGREDPTHEKTMNDQA